VQLPGAGTEPGGHVRFGGEDQLPRLNTQNLFSYDRVDVDSFAQERS
jgi:hypothetical protein